MKQMRPLFTIEGIVFVLALCGMIWIGLQSAYSIGLARGIDIGRKQCAIAPGQQVTSSTPDSCTYANTYGRSTEKRKVYEK